MKRLIFSILAICYIASNGFSQKLNQSYLDYINLYKDIAVREMNLYRIPASITLAQGLLESSAGKSELAVKANNHFGIKCQGSWIGDVMYADDDQKNECFRKYNSALESYEDHSKFLVDKPRYAGLFKLSSADYQGWAHGLKAAGYATNPNYGPLLIKLIEDYKLYDYDKDLLTKEKKEELVQREEMLKKAANQPAKPQEQSYIAEISPYTMHDVGKINGVKYVIAYDGDTYASIADEFDLFDKEVLKANDLNYGAQNPKAGDIVFIAKKKKKGSKKGDATYTAQEGEDMRLISQKNGIRLRKLYELNNIIYGSDIKAGDVIKLRK